MSVWLLRGAARLVLARYPEHGPEIVATAKAGATATSVAQRPAAANVFGTQSIEDSLLDRLEPALT